MIRPKEQPIREQDGATAPAARVPSATVGTGIPRVLMLSEVAPGGDKIDILRPLYKDDTFLRRFIASRIAKKRRYERIPLDPRGSRIWCLIDNRRTVDDLIAEYRKIYPDDQHQLEVRVHRYLSILADHGFLEIVER